MNFIWPSYNWMNICQTRHHFLQTSYKITMLTWYNVGYQFMRDRPPVQLADQKGINVPSPNLKQIVPAKSKPILVEMELIFTKSFHQVYIGVLLLKLVCVRIWCSQSPYLAINTFFQWVSFSSDPPFPFS